MLFVEQHGSEPHSFVHDEIVALLVPNEHLLTLDVVAQRGDQLLGSIPAAIRTRHRCACRRGRRRRRTARRPAVRLAAPTPRCRCAAGTGPGGRGAGEAVGEGQRAARRRVSAAIASTVEAHAAAPGDVGGAIADAADVPPIGPLVALAGRTTSATRSARSAGSSSARPRRTSRSSTSAATTHARPCRFGRRATMRARRGCTGSPTSPARRGRTTRARRCAPSSTQQLVACCSARGGGGSTKRSCSSGVPHAASSSASPARSTWVISASRWAAAGGVLELAPQPVGDARLGAPGAPGALVGRGAAGRPSSAGSSRCRGRSAARAPARRRRRSRTPSTVSDVSAMSVASTTRRRPGGDGASARSCSASDSAPASGCTSTSSDADRSRSCSTRRISPMPGQEHEHVAAPRRCSARSDGLARAPPRCAVPCHRCGSQRTSTGNVRPALSTTGRIAAGTARQLGDVGRRRHRQHAQVRAQRGSSVERERQAEVGRQVALVDLVEDHRGRRRAARDRAAAVG